MLTHRIFFRQVYFAKLKHNAQHANFHINFNYVLLTINYAIPIVLLSTKLFMFLLGQIRCNSRTM